MKIVSRIFLRFYQFYDGIEEDEAMVFYFASFAISLLLFFYFHLIWAFFYKITRNNAFEFNGFSSVVVAFIFVITGATVLWRRKKSIETKMQKMTKHLVIEDVIVALFVIGGFFCMFYSMVIFKIASVQS